MRAPGTRHHAPCTMHHAPCTMHHAPCTHLGEHVVVSEHGVDTELHQRRAVGGGEEVRVHVDHLGRVHLLHDHPTAWSSCSMLAATLRHAQPYAHPHAHPHACPPASLTPTAPPVRRPRAAASTRGRGAPPAGVMPRRSSEARRPASGGAASTRAGGMQCGSQCIARCASRTALCLGRALRRALRGALHGAWGMG